MKMKYDLKKMNFANSLIEDLKKVQVWGLEDEVVSAAFLWEEAPEGAVFWEKQYYFGLTPEGLAALAEIIAQAEAAQ